MKKRLFLILFVLLSVMALANAQSATEEADAVELRITWYDDGSEGEVLRGLLDRFEEENPGITVVVDTVAYGDTYHPTIQAQVEAGTPPDLARVNDVARFAGSYLDLTDLVADAEYYTTNFSEGVLNSMRSGEEDTGIYGFPLQFTLTAPFINRTLFEQAGVAVPSDENEEVTWDEWVEAAQEVAEATGTPYAIAFEPRGHRMWGFVLSQGGSFFDDEGNFVVDSQGFRTAAEQLISWHEQGLTDPQIWASKDFAIAREAFINGQVVFIYSGSFVVGQFTEAIGDSFDWSAVPNPVGPGGSTGSPGGSLLVAFEGTQYPEEVAQLVDFLTQEDVLEEFSLGSSFIPGHLGLVEQGLEYENNSEVLNVFLSEVANIDEEAYQLQYSPYAFTFNTPISNRLSQVLVGELTLDEAIEAIQEDVDTAIAAVETE